MGILTEYEDNRISYKGRRYPLDLAYDTVLNVQRMFREKKLSDGEMLLEALNLFKIPAALTERLTWKERSDLLQHIYEEKITTRARPSVGKQQKLFDFEEDGEYIYASFLQAYGIDLIQAQGSLTWKCFIALFQGLPEGTKIREVMRIRGMDIPARTRTNQKEIQSLMESKSYYALGYRENNGAEGLERLFSTLDHMG